MSLLSGFCHYKRKRRLSAALDTVIGSCDEVRNDSKAKISEVDSAGSKRVRQCKRAIGYMVKQRDIIAELNDPPHSASLGRNQHRIANIHYKRLSLAPFPDTPRCKASLMLTARRRKHCCGRRRKSQVSCLSRLQSQSASQSFARDLNESTYSQLPEISVTYSSIAG